MMKMQIVLIVLLTGVFTSVRPEVSTFAFNINGHKYDMPQDLVRRAAQEWYESTVDSAALIAYMDSLVSEYDPVYGLEIRDIRLPDSLTLRYFVDSTGADAYSGRIMLDEMNLQMFGFGCDLYASVTCIGLWFGGGSLFDQGDYQLHLNSLQVLEPEVVLNDSGCGLGELSLLILQEMLKQGIIEYLERFSSQFASFLSQDLLARLNPVQSLGIQDPDLLAAAMRGFPMHMSLYTEYDKEQDTVQLVQNFEILTGTVEHPKAFIGIEPDIVTDALLHYGGFGFNYWGLQRAFVWHAHWDEAQRVDAVFHVMQEYNISGYRLESRWRNLQKRFILGSDLHPNDLTPTVINTCLADTALWNSDEFGCLQRILDRGNSSALAPFVILGAGHEDALPLLNDGRVVAPATESWIAPQGFVGVSAEEYLYNLKLYAHAVIRRFADDVDVWQLENELNAAGWAAADSTWWRQGDLWLDEEFRNRVWSTLVEAVHAEDASARITHDFHMLDIMPALQSWLDDLDIVGVNFYPNAVTALPVLGFSVGEYVWAVRRALKGLGCPKMPVWVIETGYPGKEIKDPPDSLNLAKDSNFFSESRQALYIQDAMSSAVLNGAQGFFYYTLVNVENDDAASPVLDRYLRYCGLIRRNTDVPKSGLQVFADFYQQLRSSVTTDREFSANHRISIAPNPFNSGTVIYYDLHKPMRVTLSVFNLRGQCVRRLRHSYMDAGYHQIVWDGTSAKGAVLASGIYFCRIETPGKRQTVKMLFVR